jgi:hypothetical protein
MVSTRAGSGGSTEVKLRAFTRAVSGQQLFR